MNVICAKISIIQIMNKGTNIFTNSSPRGHNPNQGKKNVLNTYPCKSQNEKVFNTSGKTS